nr:MAG: ORF1 [Torque teno midi virus]
MPFWWRRRRRFWKPYNTWNKRRKTYRRRRRRYKRRRPRRTFRRHTRRRRRKKVRKKKQTITIKQWQPDSIVKCRIKGIGVLVLGAQGKQLVCYTNVKKAWTPQKAPGGGGFGVEQFSLGYLYREYTFRNNIWTKSNIAKDLCRYLGVRFTFYRHPETDFIINYDRQPPFDIDQFTYPFTHPQQLLLGRHKIILASRKTKPSGKTRKKIFIKPPKQMITKWFFQHHFATAPLCLIRAAAANFNYAHLGCCNTNQIVTFSYLDITFYQNGGWANTTAQTTPYKPYGNISSPLYFYQTYEDLMSRKNYTKVAHTTMTYASSTDYKTGWFQPKVLTAKYVTDSNPDTQYPPEGPRLYAALPINHARYNINEDNGKGNKMWLHSIYSSSYDPPQSDKILIIEGLPLYMMLYGWLSYVQAIKKAQDFFNTYIIVIECPSFRVFTEAGATQRIIPIDLDFINGKGPYGEVITQYMYTHWYPNLYNQLSVLNEFVCAGPFVPKYQRTTASTWELHYFYQFFFKWGGPEITDHPVADPADQKTYDVPDKIQGTIQVRNPEKQTYESILHPWDYRRGILTKTALKRMYSNISTDTTFQPDAETPKKKKKTTGPCLTVPQEENQEILNCLRSLCEESTWQEPQTEQEIKQLIHQQQLQQQQLRRNILQVLSDMKEQQNILQLQQGFIS